jgi:hypothetical protein
MAEPPLSLDARLAIVEHALAEVDHRLRAIENGLTPVAAGALPEAEPALVTLPPVDVAGTSALAGRAFLLLAGAYLLRALAESGMVNRGTGAALGLAYALALTAVAYRVAPRQRASASWLAGCTVLISFPLLWEITIRFALLSPPVSALVLTGTVIVILTVAWRRSLHAVAWIATIGACSLASGLLVATQMPLPFSVFLIGLGIATLWLGYDREWTGLRWVAAVFANVSIVALISRALAVPPLESPSSVMGILILALVGYLGSIAIRTLVRKRSVLPFEVVQTAALLTVVLAGAVWIARQTGSGAALLGPTLLSLAVASYAVAFMHREWHARAANYYFYTTLALVFAMTSGGYLFADATAGALWAVLALGMSVLSRRLGRTTLQVHAIVYLLIGAWTTGLASMLGATLFGPAAAASGVLPGGGWLINAAVLACWWLAVAPVSPLITRIPRTILMLLVVVAAAGVTVIAIRAMVLPLVDATLQPALIATARTAAIAAGAVLVAWLARHPATGESGWLLYPMLAWGLLELLFEDFRVSPPSLLFVALGLYGAALIIAPRLAKRAIPNG